METPPRFLVEAPGLLFEQQRIPGRVSPSVTTPRPASSWSFTTSSTAASSMRSISPAPMVPAAWHSRASFNHGGRSRLPTVSALAPIIPSSLVPARPPA